MAVFKCKMCGADLNITEDIKIVECAYCGSTQTLPTFDNEKKINLFNRANRLRMSSEFDKAAVIYENIIAEFPEDAEGYWGLCLCNYGIEYVDDPLTGEKKPTCHRASFEEISKDENFSLALEYADITVQRFYRNEAREIDRIMSEFLSISKTEDPYDVFICYKETDIVTGERTQDSVIAQDLYDSLTAKGMKVFFARITLEEKLGRQYEPYIFAALNSAKVMLCIGTKYENFHAVWVKNEWARFLKLAAKDKSKVLIPCYKDMDAYDMPDEFRMLQAQDLSKIGAIQDIVRGVEKLTLKNTVSEASSAQTVGGINTQALLSRGYMAIEDREWKKAEDFFNRVLDMDAENARAYMGLCLCEIKIPVAEAIPVEHFGNRNYLRAKRFADADFLETITAHENSENSKLSAQRRMLLETQEQKEQLRIEKQKKFMSIMSSDRYVNRISAGINHSVALNADGKLIVIGNFSQFYTTKSTLTSVYTGNDYTLGINTDGIAVLLRGDRRLFGQNNNFNRDILSLAIGANHILALKKDSRVVSIGNSSACNTEAWSDIIEISAGKQHSVGLTIDGTVVAAGENPDGRCNVSSWKNIISVVAGDTYTIGITKDHTVVITGIVPPSMNAVSSWKNVMKICTGPLHIAALLTDGTVVAAGSNSNGQCNVSSWTDILAISVGYSHTMGLRFDGTLVGCGSNFANKINFDGINLSENTSAFGDESNGKRFISTMEQRSIDKEKWERARLENLRTSNRCTYCGGTLLFTTPRKCASCGRVRNY